MGCGPSSTCTAAHASARCVTLARSPTAAVIRPIGTTSSSTMRRPSSSTSTSLAEKHFVDVFTRGHLWGNGVGTTIWRLMRVRFWGTRGSVPTPGQSTVRYGGNTACVELRTSAGAFIIFDSGTGIRELGLHLARQGGPVAAHLMLGHTHWDHISGFPFFTPLFVPGNHVTIYGARDLDRSL